MSSGAGAPEMGAKATPQRGSRADIQGAPAKADALPVPDEQPLAPMGDLVTVRVKEVRPRGRMESYFSARAYEAGVEIGHVNATTREAALAGGMAVVQSTWAGREANIEASGARDRGQ